MRVVVIGAGAFGGWAALNLVRRGARVTLVDAWGPGNPRASSGGETRIIRATYGARPIYTSMARRALELWRAHDKAFGTHVLRQTGALWMSSGDPGFSAASLATLREVDVPVEEIPRPLARRRYPQIDFDDVQSIFLEPDAGYLLASLACQHVAARFTAEGGVYRRARVLGPVEFEGARTPRLRLDDSTTLEADAVVFSVGPWMGALLPDVIGARVVSTKQEVFYFQPPDGDRRFLDSSLPVWLDLGERLVYGIPGHAGRHFKVADDTSGPVFEPTDGDRTASAAGAAALRGFLARRFPALAQAPLVGSEVCQYEATPDSDFIVDRHPSSPSIWIVGGGSGHGFKMGPALGELVARLVLDDEEPPATFRLERFTAVSEEAVRPKWS